MKKLHTLLILLAFLGLILTPFCAFAVDWSGTKNFTSNTTINDNITLVGSTTIGVYANVTVTINGVITSGNESFSLTITGDGGTVVFNAANTYYGETKVGNATLRLGTNGRIDNSKALTLTWYTACKFEITSDDKKVKKLNSEYATAEVSLANRSLYIGTSATSNDGGGTFKGVFTGSGNIIKTGTQTLTLTGANTYSGGTYIDAGKLVIGESGTIASSSGVTFHYANTKLEIQGGDKWIKTLYSNHTNSEVILGSNYLYIGSSFTSDDGGGTFAGKFSGSGGIVKRGTQTLTLSGQSTHTGITNIDAGTLKLTTNNAIAASGGVTFYNPNTKLEIATGNTSSTHIKSINSTHANSEIIITGNAWLDIGTSTTSDDGGGTFAGVISGTGNLAKWGTKTFTLTGHDAFTGKTEINSGKLVLAQAGNDTHHSSGVTLKSGSKLVIKSGDILCFYCGCDTILCSLPFWNRAGILTMQIFSK